MLANLDVDILYAQLVVFEMPFRDMQWTDQHTAQGFAWTSGAVSFGTPSHVGTSRVEVFRDPGFSLDQTCLWAVQVPFDVKSGEVMIGSVVDPQAVAVDKGSYNLVFQALPPREDATFVFQLYFIPSQTPDYAILKRGTELQTDQVLRRDADVYH